MISKKFYATMDWWEVAEQPVNQLKIILFLDECKKLWESGGENSTKAIKRLKKHLRSKFLIKNLQNYEEIFGDIENTGPDEVDSDILNLIDVDFSVGPIPLCKTEAEFLIPIKRFFKEIDLIAWQEENNYFYDAITFSWNFDEIELCDLDLTFGRHSGVECILKD
jgi:hypothetical protein